ncbi:MAG TPA: hypothetical protein VI197_20505 [Polyangiaceae bacterium]
MKIIHRIGFRATDAQRRELEALGVKVPAGIAMPGGGNAFVAFDVTEGHSNWIQIRTLLQRWDISGGAVRTKFSNAEIAAASWLELGAWHHGYPQPNEGVFGYRQATYDLTDWCEQCSVGMTQRASFQMKGEPTWGRNSMLQLVWVYDEIFVKPELWTSVFKPHGIGCRVVMNTKGAELKTVVQVLIEEEVGIVTDGLPFEECMRCRRAKYLPITRGAFPSLTSGPSQAIVKTKEYFGSGGQANKRVLVSRDLARALAAGNVRGAELRPVAK